MKWLTIWDSDRLINLDHVYEVDFDRAGYFELEPSDDEYDDTPGAKNVRQYEATLRIKLAFVEAGQFEGGDFGSKVWSAEENVITLRGPRAEKTWEGFIEGIQGE